MQWQLLMSPITSAINVSTTLISMKSMEDLEKEDLKAIILSLQNKLERHPGCSNSSARCNATNLAYLQILTSTEWTRMTHDFDNGTREWVFREELRDVHPVIDTPCGVHALDSGYWYSTSSIYRSNVEYCKQHGEPIPPMELIVDSLMEMERLGFIRRRK